MTTPTEKTITALQAHAGLQALVGNGDSPETYRIYNMVMPQDVAMPAISVQKVAQTRENTLADSGGSGMENARMRLAIYARTLSAAEAASEQARLAMAAAGATDFRAIQVFNLDQYDNDTKLYQVVVDYSVWYRH